MLSAALYDEQLGDHHRFGFPSDTALVVARSTLFLAVVRGMPSIAAYDAHLFGYRSLRAPLPESGSGRWPLGWELFGTLEGDRARALAIAPKVGWGVLAPLVDRGELTDHPWAACRWRTPPIFRRRARPASARTPGDQALSTPLSLELRAGLGPSPRYRSWCAGAHLVRADGGAHRRPARASTRRRERASRHTWPWRRARASAAPRTLRRWCRARQIVRTTLTFTGASSATEATFGVGFDLR